MLQPAHEVGTPGAAGIIHTRGNIVCSQAKMKTPELNHFLNTAIVERPYRALTHSTADTISHDLALQSGDKLPGGSGM